MSTHVRLLSGVDTEVPGQCSRVTETLGAHRAGVGPLPCVDSKVSLEVLHAVELPIAHSATEGAAARRVKLQSAPPASHRWLRNTLLGPLLALAGVPPQQAGQVEHLATVLAGVTVARGAAGPNLDPVDLWRRFCWGGGGFCQLEDVWKV